MADPILTIPMDHDHPLDELLSKEWLVTNGLGGYASGTVLGINTRRHHGLFVPNLSAPRGRTMMLPHLYEAALIDGKQVSLSGAEFNEGAFDARGASFLKEFRLEWQTPVWTFDINGRLLEKSIFMPYGCNTVCVRYTLIEGDSLQMQLRPYGNCRKHDSHLGHPMEWPFTVTFQGERYEMTPFEGAPTMRMTFKPFSGVFVTEPNTLKNLFYRMEFRRGLDCTESLYSPGYFSLTLKKGEPVCFVATTEGWDALPDDPVKTFEAEIRRRKKLVAALPPEVKDIAFVAQLALASDQFIVLPRTRNETNVLLDASSEKVRTVIAGYHWFTDWGRDTMISLEGLTLCMGRHDEAKAILHTFGHYVKNGLLPNHFPEGERDAIYNTVDATFWYFHALDCYLRYTRDRETLEVLYPTLRSIIDYHMRGTWYGIHMDKTDGLIQAAAEGYQLTWMDAKVDEWVVTPRRGKPVEIQALWFNALRLMDVWSKALEKPDDTYIKLSHKVFESFNSRFWFEKGRYLYDVVDTKQGHDASLRPNQVMALSLRFPVLDRDLWKPVVDIVEEKLLTPYGLRTLDPADKLYHGRYEGNRWERDAAYHQGLVWTWLIGPFMDAWKKVYNDPQKARMFLNPFEKHLSEAGIGTVSEIFDGDAPYTARGCIAQAWSVAEVLRCTLGLVEKKSDTVNSRQEAGQ